MTDQELYKLINNELFKTGSCKPNKWQFMKLENKGKYLMFEVIYPTKGNIRIRKPFKKLGKNCFGQELYLYNLYRFTNKRELVDAGIIEDIRLDQQTEESITI